MNNQITILDLSLNNLELYKGCDIETAAGRKNLTTPIAKAIDIVGTNLLTMSFDINEVILTGPMAVWVYLLAFHQVVHITRSVYYRDAKDEYLIAKHG